MTQGMRPAPPHGGLFKVAFDGATGSGRKQLPFQAAAVNVDNWSPYWVKLEPVEEYIPPFQHDVNISLPLINSYEFKTLAPPGLEQADIVLPANNAIPGNSYPVICVFSSTPSNNDPGFNALDSSANTSTNIVSATAPVGSSVLFQFDVTNYNGIYLYFFPQGSMRVLLEYDAVVAGVQVFTPFYTREFYNHEPFMFTIPKMSRHIRVEILNSTVGVVQLQYSIRPFLGAVDTFFATPLSDNPNTVNNAPISGEYALVTAGGQVNFPCAGIDNGAITVNVQTTAAPTANTMFNAQVFIFDYGGVVGAALIASHAFMYGQGNHPLVIPIMGILERQGYVINVRFDSTLVGTQAIVAFHHIYDGVAPTQLTRPNPVFYRVASSIPNDAVIRVVGTMPIWGEIRSMRLTIRTTDPSSGADLLIFLGDATAAQYALGSVPTGVLGSYDFRFDPPFVTFIGFQKVWFLCNGVAPISVNFEYCFFIS